MVAETVFILSIVGGIALIVWHLKSFYAENASFLHGNETQKKFKYTRRSICYAC